MMKKITFALSILGLTVVLFSSSGCYYDHAQDLAVNVTCDTTSPTYTLRVAPIISSRCAGCHSQQFNSSNILLDTYETLSAYAGNGGPLLPDIKQTPGTIFNPMPKSSSKISDCDIAIIEAWIHAGKPR